MKSKVLDIRTWEDRNKIWPQETIEVEEEKKEIIYRNYCSSK